MKKSVFCIAALAAFMMFFAGCANSSGGDSDSGSGKGKGGGGNGGGSNNTPKTTEKVITAAEGGEVKVGDEVTITIPAGALDNDTKISVTYYKNDKDISKYPSSFIGGVKFGPDGTVFNTSVEVKLKLTANTSETLLSVFCYDEEEEIWDFVTTATVEDGYAKFTVKHFSIYELMEKFPTKTDKFVELVDIALDIGQSNEWIMSKYTEYLINEEKVLDEYKYYDGYWFEPCGIDISGDYYVNGKRNEASMFNMIGTSNMVGNKFGYSWIESGDYSETVSHRSVKNRITTATGKQKLYSSFFIINYQMIQPVIELKADKTTLIKGESTTVEVYCHYNGKPMNQYELELPYKLKYFQVSTDKVITDDNGKATFTITAVDKGKEYVKVQFYREGYLTGRPDGKVYSAGDLLFTCGGIDISGHITEVRDSTFDIPAFDGYVETTQKGKLNIQIDYDFEGILSITDEETGEVEGSITFSNVDVDIDTTSHNFTGIDEDGYIYTRVKLFKTFNSETSRLSYKVKGVLKNNRCELSYDCDADALLMVEGKTEIWMSTSGGSGSTENDIAFVLFAGGDNTPLYDFELENGTATEEYNGFKDEFMTSAAYGWFLLEYYPEDPTKSKRTLTTTQTITVELPEED